MRAAAAVLLFAALLLVRPAQAADEDRLTRDQAAIVFLVSGDAIGGELQIRETDRPVVAWSTLISQNSVRRFIVRPGSYALRVEPNRELRPIRTTGGKVTVVALSAIAADRTFAVIDQREVAPDALEEGSVATFLSDHHVSPQALAPVSLEYLGRNLSFFLRANL
jgi:hypothetical protein